MVEKIKFYIKKLILKFLNVTLLHGSKDNVVPLSIYLKKF